MLGARRDHEDQDPCRGYLGQCDTASQVPIIESPPDHPRALPDLGARVYDVALPESSEKPSVRLLAMPFTHKQRTVS